MSPTALFWGVAFLATAQPISERERSTFNPKQMSSEAIWVGVHSCLTSIPAQAKAQLGTRAAASYCACTMDAITAKGQAGTTESDLRFCMNRARAAAASTGNAFRKGEWSSEAIVAAIDTCETSYAPGDRAKIGSANALWAFCSCVVDARRARSTDKASVSDMKLCLDRARARYPS